MPGPGGLLWGVYSQRVSAQQGLCVCSPRVVCLLPRGCVSALGRGDLLWEGAWSGGVPGLEECLVWRVPGLGEGSIPACTEAEPPCEQNS